MRAINKAWQQGRLGCAVILACMIIFALLSLHGRANRTFLPQPRAALVPSPRGTYAFWKDTGVRGRIHFLFDRHLHAAAPGPEAEGHSTGLMQPDRSVADDNYMFFAIRGKIVRAVYHVVPDAAWPEVESVLSQNKFVHRSGGMFKMTSVGVSITILKLQDVPAVREPVLLDINSDSWTGAELQQIIDLVKRKILLSDCITVSGAAGTEYVNTLLPYATLHQ